MTKTNRRSFLGKGAGAAAGVAAVAAAPATAQDKAQDKPVKKVIYRNGMKPEKAPLFNLPERLLMLEAMTADFKNVRVETFDGLMVDYAAKVKASAVLRGIRAISDYEYELQMALMNRKLQPELETVFMMPAEQYSYLSSRLVREIAQLGGSVKDLVPELVEQRLKEKLDPAIKLANARKLKPRKRG